MIWITQMIFPFLFLSVPIDKYVPNEVFKVATPFEIAANQAVKHVWHEVRKVKGRLIINCTLAALCRHLSFILSRTRDCQWLLRTKLIFLFGFLHCKRFYEEWMIIVWWQHIVSNESDIVTPFKCLVTTDKLFTNAQSISTGYVPPWATPGD